MGRPADLIKFILAAIVLLAVCLGCVTVIVVSMRAETDPLSNPILMRGEREGFLKSLVKGLTFLIVEATKGEESEFFEPMETELEGSGSSGGGSSKSSQPDEKDDDARVPTMKKLDTMKTAEDTE